MEHFYCRVIFLVFSFAVGISNVSYALQNDVLSGYFVENKGQVLNENHQPANKVLFYTTGVEMQVFVTGTGYSMLVTEDSELNSTYHKIDIQLVDADIRRENIVFVKGNHPQLNFYQSSRRIEDASSSNMVIIRDIYQGIDWLWSIDKEGTPKHEFMVNIGADASRIKYLVNGAESSAGRLNHIVYKHPAFTVSEGPVMIQYKDSLIAVGVKLEGQNVTFPVPAHLKGGGFTIDPPLKLLYSQPSDNLKTVFRSLSLDANHNTFSTGASRDYAVPVFIEINGSYTSYPPRTTDIVIMKSDSIQNLLWATFFGGVNRDEANAVVSYPGGIFITGFSESWDFPVAVAGNYNELVSLTGRDAFIAKFDKFGKYQWSSGYGGSGLDEGLDIQYLNGKVYVAGYTASKNFPQLQRVGSYYYEDILRTRNDAFVLEFDTSCNRRWATTFGGTGHDYFTSLSVDPTGIYLTGYSDSITGGGVPLQAFGSAYFQATSQQTESFITAFTLPGAIQWSTYFGAEKDDIATSILKNDCGLFVCGRTSSTGLPVQSQLNGNFYQATNAGGANDGFIVKFDPFNLQKRYCTYYGTPENDVLTKLAGNSACETIFTGFTSGNIPTFGTKRFYHQYFNKGGVDGLMLGLNALQAPFWGTHFGSGRNDYAHDVEFYTTLIVDMVGEGFYNYGRPRIGGTYSSDSCSGVYCPIVTSNGVVNRFLNNDSIFKLPGYGGGGGSGGGGSGGCFSPLFFQALIPIENACPNQCNGVAIVDTANIGGCPPYTLLWNSGRIGIQDTGLCELHWSKVIDDNGQSRTIFSRFDVLRAEPVAGVITNCGLMPRWDTIIHPEGGGPPYTINFRGVLNDACPTVAYFDIRDTSDCIISYSLPWYRYNTNLYPKLQLTGNCEVRAGIYPKSELCLDYTASDSWKYVVYSGTDTFIIPFVKGSEVFITQPTTSGYYEGYLDLGTCTQPMDRILFMGNTMDSVKTKIDCQDQLGEVIVTVYPDTNVLNVTGGYWVWVKLKADTTYLMMDSVFVNSTSPEVYTFTGLLPKTYYASVYTSACDTSYEEVEIKVIAVAFNNPGSYCGKSDTLIALVTGGNPPYTYVWAGDTSTTDRIFVTVGGTYEVTVSDTTGCEISETVFVPSTPGFSIDSVSENLIPCSATLFSKATVYINGGTSPYYYLWSSGEITPTANSIAQGSNWVIARDATGCADTLAFMNTKKSLVEADDSTTDVTCYGYANGSIILNISRGYPVFDVQWSGGYTGATIGPLDIGNYQYTVTDAMGCTVSGAASVTQPDSIKYFATAGDATCAASDGFAALSVTGGVSPFSFLWSDSSTLPVRQNLAFGSYGFTITDGNGCNKSGVIEIGNETLMYLTASVKNVTCYGQQNGAISVSIFNAFSPFTYEWSNNSDSSNLSNLDSGFYYLTVTDNQGCVLDTVFYINKPLPLEAVLDTGFGIRCSANEVEVKITATGGTAPYYGTDTLMQGPGTYSVTITDTMGCSVTLDYSLTESPFLDVSLTVSQQPDCRHPKGTFMATATGGLPPYEVYINGIPRALVDTLFIPNLSAGTYVDSIVDFSGCAVSFTNEIVAYTKLNDTSTFTNPTCYNSNNGTVSLNMIGAGPFDYLGNIFTSSFTIDSLFRGDYSFIVYDTFVCPDTINISLTGPDELIPGYTVKEPIRCTGDSATIFITAAGGVTPYSGTDTLFQPAGIYQVLVTDSVGCTATLDYTLTDPPLLIAKSEVFRQPNCTDVNGILLATASGGGLPYRFYIDSILKGSFSDSLMASGIPVGTHSSYIIDSFGCSQSFSAVLNTYPILQDSAVIFHPTCFGLNNGSVTLHIQGAGPFMYQGNSFISTYRIDSLLAGDYTFVVTDTLGCPDTIRLSLVSPPELKGNYQTVQGIICHDDSALLNITFTGGTLPVTGGGNYRFPDGIFQVTLTDSFGCTANVSDTLVAPPVLTESHSTVSAACVIPGSLTIVAEGGVGPYQLLTGTNFYTFRDTITHPFIAGSYTIRLKDSLGCIIDTNFTVGSTDSIKGNIRAKSLRCHNDNSGEVVITMQYGNKPYLVNGLSFNDSIVFNNLASGPYIYNVTDVHGCSTYLSGILTQPDALKLDSNVLMNGITCDDRADAVLYMDVDGGTPGYLYALTGTNGNTSQRTPLFSGIASGNYSVVVTDTLGCSRSLNFVVPAFVPSVHELAVSHLTCYEHPEGTIKIYSRPGDRGTYTYSLNGDTAQVYDVFSGLAAGNYTIVVADGNGCRDTLSTALTQPDSIDSRVWLNGLLLPQDSTFLFERMFASFTKQNNLPWTIEFSPDVDRLVDNDTLVMIQPRADITYVVTVYFDTIHSDCFVQYKGIIRLIAVPDLPNIITPNGDGLNDTWQVDLDKYPDPEVTIFDRWGETIYHTEHYQNEWDGSYKQTTKRVPDGTYFYIMKVPSHDGAIYKGNINVLDALK